MSKKDTHLTSRLRDSIGIEEIEVSWVETTYESSGSIIQWFSLDQVLDQSLKGMLQAEMRI